jgi:hypothetical protein
MILVPERYEEVVAAVPFVGASWPDVELGEIVELLVGPLVPAVIHEE